VRHRAMLNDERVGRASVLGPTLASVAWPLDS
jgi:hypothetical protein